MVISRYHHASSAQQHDQLQPLREPLTDSEVREVRVLRYLPTNLSAPEIASEPSISWNTGDCLLTLGVLRLEPTKAVKEDDAYEYADRYRPRRLGDRPPRDRHQRAAGDRLAAADRCQQLACVADRHHRGAPGRAVRARCLFHVDQLRLHRHVDHLRGG
jgi:hypothetical protein